MCEIACNAHESSSFMMLLVFIFFFSSRRRHTRLQGDWSSDVCSSDLLPFLVGARLGPTKILWREHAEKVAGADGGHIFLSLDVLLDGIGLRPGSAATRRARASGVGGRTR